MVPGPFVPALLLVAFVAQLTPKPGMLQRVQVEPSISAEKVAPGGSVTLLVKVTPNRDVRVFAPGSKDYSPVLIALNTSHDYSLGKPKYPTPERQGVPGTKKKVLLYDSRFNLEQTITISKKAVRGETLKISGLLSYQACDDRSVYARSGIP